MNTAAAQATPLSRLELRVLASASGLAQATQAFEQFLLLHDIDSRARKRLALVLEEVVMNLAMHGHAEPGDRSTEHHAELSLSITPELLELVVRDNGRPFDPLAAALPVLPGSLEEARPGGLGLTLIHRFSRAMHYTRADDHNCLSLALDRS